MVLANFDKILKIEMRAINSEPLSCENKVCQHNHWEIFLFKEGSGTHLIDFETVNLSGNSVHIVPPNHLHQINRSYCQGLQLKISDEFLHNINENNWLISELYSSRSKTPVIHFSNDDFKVVWELVKFMGEEITNTGGGNIFVLRNFLNILLYKLDKGFNGSGLETINPVDLTVFIRFSHLVEKHIQNYNKVDDYLKLLGITRKKLFVACVCYGNTSPGDYIRRRLLTEAKRLLLFSSSSQKEIAYRLNFTDLPHFIKFFKRRAGMLPKEFARQLIYK